ncbi:T-cell surface antigen CD2-like [Garra rufa]|uniref:T-cell surface antigen CD2-like n=1 Tax=Garra rufa TaxID=137080 RepID=UPI003CCE92D9
MDFDLVLCLQGVFGESVSVLEGDSVTLNTDVTEIHEDDDILWNFITEKSLLAEISREVGIFFTYNGTDRRFRDRLKLDNQTASLTITKITPEHAGLYEVKISGEKLLSKTFNVSVYAHLPTLNIIRDCSLSSYCSLVCSVVNVGHVTLSWYKGNSSLSSISVSDLSISLSLPLEVEYQDNNTYSCVLNNPISNQTQHPNITELCHTCPDQGLPLFYIVLISAAAGSLLIATVVKCCCICWKFRKTEFELETLKASFTNCLRQRKLSFDIKIVQSEKGVGVTPTSRFYSHPRRARE